MEFEREELLIGDKINVLKEKTILVLGLGGVGGYVTESLARCGIGNLILVDYDKVDITNINRQIIATYSNIGRLKTECFKERIADINKECNVTILNMFYGEENRDSLFNQKIDYVIDCCDSLNSKVILIEECFKRNIPVISCMGTGNKLHPQKFLITKLKKTEYDPLAKKLRFLLKDKKELLEVDVLYSKEQPTEYKGKIGSISYVPSVAGLLLTSYVINKFIKA
jgi:tRNA A37 threonylcarbamoyladenosine dehydratase